MSTSSLGGTTVPAVLGRTRARGFGALSRWWFCAGPLAVLLGIAGILMPGCGDDGADVLKGTLESKSGAPGWFVLRIANTSDKTVRFVDVPEGAAACGELYEVVAEKDGRVLSSNGKCLYTHSIPAQVIELIPGQTRDRDVQPEAYLGREQVQPPCAISVKYRLTDRMRRMRDWPKTQGEINLDVTFETPPVPMESFGVRFDDLAGKVKSAGRR